MKIDNTQINTPFLFSKSHSLYVKSVAVILMIIHHLFLFPDRINQDLFTYPSLKFCGKFLQYSISSFGQICVAVFMFISGFGFCRKYIKESNIEDIFKGILISVRKKFISFWKIFIIFIPLGFIFFSNNSQYCNDTACCFAYKNFSWGNLICNFFAWQSNLNREWWFLQSYLICVFCFPFFYKLIKNKSFVFDFSIFLVLYFLQIFIFPYFSNIANFPLNSSVLFNLLLCPHSASLCFFWGMIFAKNKRLEKLINICNSVFFRNVFLNFIGLFICFYFREYIFNNLLDCFFCLLFIICITNIFEYFKFSRRICLFLGHHSTNIWLIHSFFIYYFGLSFQKILFISHNQIVITIVTILISLICSILISLIYKMLAKL